jgi:Domain of unknown function (DUF4411)
MATLTIYSVDSSALIHGWRRIYRPKNFGFVWDRLGVLIEEERFKASIEVYNDLEKKDDELFKWCKERKDKLVVDIDETIQAHVARIMKNLSPTRRYRERSIRLRPVCYCACSEYQSHHDRFDRGIRWEGANPRRVQ